MSRSVSLLLSRPLTVRAVVRMKKARKLTEQFKFTNMSKKIDFLPALKSKEYFRDTNSVNAIGTEYMDHRDKIKTYMPDKSFKKQPNKWNL